MELVKHLTAIVYIEPKSLDNIYPKAFLPLNDDTILIQNYITALASLGCRTIWFCTFDGIPRYFKEVVGDYVPDPICYQIEPSKIDMNLIPLIYLQLIADKRQKKTSLYASCMATYSYMMQVCKANSKYFEPEKFVITSSNFVLNIRECEKLKQQMLLNNEDDWEFLDSDGNSLFFVYTKERMKYLRKMLNMKYEFKWLYNKFPKKQYFFKDGMKYENFKDYQKIIANENLTSFIWPKEFDQYKSLSYGMEHPYISQQTVVKHSIKKG